MPTLISIGASYDGKTLKEIAAAAVQEGKGVVGEGSWEVKGALKNTFGEVQKWASEWGKVNFVAEGTSTRFFKRDVPAMAKTEKVDPMWFKFHDLGRETEKTVGDKCSGLLGIMVAVGVDPEVVKTPQEEAAAVGKCCEKLLIKGNEFKRPLMCKPVTEEEKAKKKENKKRKREPEPEPEPEPEEEEEQAPVVIPSMVSLRQSMFLSSLTGGLQISDITSNINKNKPFTLKTSESPEWISTVVSTAIARNPASKPCVIAVPTTSAALESAAACTDAGEHDTHVIIGTPTPSSTYTHNVIVTTLDLLDSVINCLESTSTIVYMVGGKDELPVEKASKNTTWVAITVSDEADGVPVPVPEEESDASLESVVGIEDGEVDQRVVDSMQKSNMNRAAVIFNELFNGRQSVGASFSAGVASSLATTATPLTPPVEEMCSLLSTFHSKLSWLVMETDMVNPPASVKSAKQSSPVNEVIKAMLRAPLLPYQDPRVDKEQQNKKKNFRAVPGDVVLRTVVLSCCSRFLVDSQIDAVADLWGVKAVLNAPPTIDMHCVKYGVKKGGYAAMLEGAIVRRLDGVQLGVSIGRLAQETHWEWVLAHFGPFNKFLGRCKHAFAADKNKGTVHISAIQGASATTTVNPIPLSGRGRAEAEKLASHAVEELLTILPRGTRKALLSSVGVSISSWARFNARYNGMLGPSLYGFLIKHPEAFVVSGRAVWRADPKTSPNYETNLLKHGGREGVEDNDSVRNQKKRKVGSRAQRLHNVISDKYKRKQARKNSLRSAKIQKIPGFGKKKGKYKGKGNTPHYMK